MQAFQVVIFLIYLTGYADVTPTCMQVLEENIYVSYCTNSRSRTYKREVRNIICLFENYGYKVFYQNCDYKYSDLRSQKESWIKSAANIIVVFNKEYQQAHESFISKEKLPLSLETDIPLISYIFHSTPYGRSRIIPVVIDRCRTQPPLATFPVWLTGTPRRLFPSQTSALLACIQNTPERVVQQSGKIRILKQEIVDGDAVRKKFCDRESKS